MNELKIQYCHFGLLTLINFSLSCCISVLLNFLRFVIYDKEILYNLDWFCQSRLGYRYVNPVVLLSLTFEKFPVEKPRLNLAAILLLFAHLRRMAAAQHSAVKDREY